MKIIKSQLHLKQETLLKFSFEFITLVSEEKEPKPVNVNDIFEELEIELFFKYIKTENDDFEIFIKIEVNKEKKPGYYIMLELGSIYNLDKSLDKDLSNFLIQSALGISINKARNIISDYTSSSIMGSYNLPVLDLKQIIEENNRIVERKNQ